MITRSSAAPTARLHEALAAQRASVEPITPYGRQMRMSATHIGPPGAIVGVVHAASRLTGLPELTEVRKLWFSDWYDGAITGIAAHGDHEYWFVMVTDDNDGGFWDFDPRVYILHRISPEQLAQAWDAHRSFAAAGLPGCLHSPPCATTGATNNDMLAALRDRWPPENEDDYMNAPAVGWFRDTQRTACAGEVPRNQR